MENTTPQPPAQANNHKKRAQYQKAEDDWHTAPQKNQTNWRSHFKSKREMESGPIEFLINSFMTVGITLFGGLSGVGKTWLMLSLAKALTTGEPFLGLQRFRVPKPVPVIYMVPEMGERAFRNRMDCMSIPDDAFLCRTMKQGVPLQLHSPYLIGAVREMKPVVFLDTIIRFSRAESENSATENRGLSTPCFGLIGEGARGIVGVHHSPKASDGKVMTLENVLRGTGDLGAMCAAVYGLRAEDKENVVVKLACVKAQDFESPGTFTIQGRPYIDKIGDFGVLVPPHRSSLEEVEAVRQAIMKNQKATYRDIELATSVDKNRVAEIAKKSGFEKVNGAWHEA
jgi:hypothetical protein